MADEEQVQELEAEAVDAEAVETEAVETSEEATADQAVEKNWSNEEEQEARMLGWKPPSEWRGDVPEGYIDNPQDYLARAERITPFRKLKEQMEAEKAASEERLRKLEAMNDRALQMQKAQYQQQLESVKAQQIKAVQAGDTSTFQQLEQQRGQIEQNLAASQQPEPGPDPYIAQYAQTDEGKWVNDPMLRKVGVDAINANPAILARPAQEQVAYAEQEVKRLYPHMFQQEQPVPQPTPRQKVDGGGLASGGKDPLSKLPREAREAFHRFVKEGLFEDTKKGREEFANDYASA